LAPNNSTEHLKDLVANIPEIKMVYVLPEFQGQGIGRQMFRAMSTQLKAEGRAGFCLDCGFTHSQGFWRKQLGVPCLVLKDHWGPGADHMIWRTHFLASQV